MTTIKPSFEHAERASTGRALIAGLAARRRQVEEAEAGSAEPWWKWHDSLKRFDGPNAQELDTHFRTRWILDGGDEFEPVMADAATTTDAGDRARPAHRWRADYPAIVDALIAASGHRWTAASTSSSFAPRSWSRAKPRRASIDKTFIASSPSDCATGRRRCPR